jgi:outer membrane protein assembly factor BamB
VAAASAEPDGAVAEPSRWTGPNGPPSNSRRSRALPVTSDVVAAWTVALPGPAVVPPVTWDGTAYVLCAAGDDHQLVAVDVAKGKVTARKLLPGIPQAPIHVWGGIVYAFTRPGQVSGFRPIGSSFVEKWKLAIDDAGGYGTMTVFEGEVYIAGGRGLIRASPGLKEPVWRSPGRYHGPPAIYGESVLAVYVERDGIPTLGSHHRGMGGLAAKAQLGMPAAAPAQGAAVDITAGADDILVRTPWPMLMERGTASDAFVAYATEGNLLTALTAQGFMNFRVKAAVYKGGLIACESASEWHWWRGPKGQVIAEKSTAPDLFQGMVPPTVVGNVVYFGTWAADVETGEILWRLPMRAVRFGVVPLDRLFLVVDGEGNLHAFKSRVGR